MKEKGKNVRMTEVERILDLKMKREDDGEDVGSMEMQEVGKRRGTSRFVKKMQEMQKLRGKNFKKEVEIKERRMKREWN